MIYSTTSIIPPILQFFIKQKIEFLVEGWNNQINTSVTFYRHCISYLFSTLANHHFDAWQTFFASHWSLDFKSFTKSGQILGWIPMRWSLPSCTNEENAQIVLDIWMCAKNVPKCTNIKSVINKKWKFIFTLKMKVLLCTSAWDHNCVLRFEGYQETIANRYVTDVNDSLIFCSKTQEIFVSLEVIFVPFGTWNGKTPTLTKTTSTTTKE